MTPTVATKVPMGSIFYPPVEFTAIQILTPGGVLLAQLDGSIVLDTSGPVPVLRAAAEKVDVFNEAAAYTSVTLSATPGAGAQVKVYRNGLLMAAAIDYAIAGTVVTFSAAQGTAPGDIVQAIYA
jgi:hypothetical protein